MKITPSTFLESISIRFPETNPRITRFPSGAFIVDISVRGIEYCIEYIESTKQIGLSKAFQISPFFEGFDESFDNFEELEIRILDLVTNDAADG